MQLVEQTIISKSDPRFAAIDAASFAAKNLYNLALYEVRQSFLHEGIYLDNVQVYHRVKHTEAYQALPRKVSNDILRQLHKNWVAFFEEGKAYKQDPSTFTGRPKPPKYKDKTNGRFLLTYDQQAISKKALKRGMLAPSGLGIEVPTEQTAVKQARIVPRSRFYVVEVVYERKEQAPRGDPDLHASIDLGVDNLAAITSNKAGFVPRLVNGRPMKSTNQWYNKRRAELQSKLGHPGTTARMERLTTKRNRRINQYMHTASKRIIELLGEEGIGTLIVGKNPLWKHKVEMGKRNNQTFVQIPHARFIDLLRYKAELAGIRFLEQEESYTSKASFFDLDEIPTYDPKRTEQPHFSGKREHRGLYRAANVRRINADVHGSMNIGRKAVPHSARHGVEARAVAPVWLPVFTVCQPRALTDAGSVLTDL
ncbi:MAG: transposase [Ktedonobacteraceae bacterium]|nr:transposase [Ktedonobacteraceae bacterium]